MFRCRDAGERQGCPALVDPVHVDVCTGGAGGDLDRPVLLYRGQGELDVRLLPSPDRHRAQIRPVARAFGFKSVGAGGEALNRERCRAPVVPVQVDRSAGGA